MIRTVVLAMTLLTTAFACNTFAQELSATDLWLAKIVNGVPGEPVKISQGVSYNNQPHFSADGLVIYYTREMPGDADLPQTDIAAFHVKTSTTTMLNATPESEYSPTPIPARNAVSVIQSDLNQKQYVYAIDIENGRMEVLFPEVAPVGYHAWIDDQQAAMFIQCRRIVNIA
jgi:hypothetical protein